MNLTALRAGVHFFNGSAQRGVQARPLARLSKMNPGRN